MHVLIGAMDWSSLCIGQRTSAVLSVICTDSKGNLHLLQTQDRRGFKVWLRGDLPPGGTLAGVDLVVTSTSPMVFQADPQSMLVPVPVCDRASLNRVVDLCAGLGGFSVTVPLVGFSVAAGVDHNDRWRSLFESLHEGAQFIVGDLADTSVLRQLLGLECFHGVVCSGVSCQPHSVLGDRKGMSDPRAKSLPHSLQLAWLLQAAVVLLECTPEVLRDAQAQELLRQFTVATGYRLSQTILRLSNTWCTKRDRWVAVLTAPVVHPCYIPDMPCLQEIQVVRDLIPEFLPWPKPDQDQLELNLYELSKYYQYAAGGIDGAWVRMDDKLPTLLHSAGNQMYTCACGCRAALSETRLRQKGLVGVLIPLSTCQTHMNLEMRHARYLHPVEMWALMGGNPQAPMGNNLRLAMAGVGQAVAPLMGLWIFSHVRQCLDWTFELPPCDPLPVLKSYMSTVLQECRSKWSPGLPMTVADVDDDPVEDVEDAAQPKVVTLTRPCTGEPDVTVKLSPGTTGVQLLAAEAQLGVDVTDYTLRIDGEKFDATEQLRGSSLVSLVSPDWDPANLYATPAIPCCFDADEFLRYVHASDATRPGFVTDLEGLRSARCPVFSKAERVGLLAQQGPVWGDDEVLHGLMQTELGTEEAQYVHVWDPLLVTGLIHHEDQATWQYLVSELGHEATVISAVLLGGHWIPLVWRVDMVGSQLHSLSVTMEFVSVLEKLSRIIEIHRGGARGTWRAHDPGFTPVGHCGALARLLLSGICCGVGRWSETMSPCPTLLPGYVGASLNTLMTHVIDRAWLALDFPCQHVLRTF